MPFLGIATGASRKENVSQVLVYILLHVGPTSGEEGTGYMQQHIHVHVPEALANVVREREVVYVTLPAIPAYAEHPISQIEYIGAGSFTSSSCRQRAVKALEVVWVLTKASTQCITTRTRKCESNRCLDAYITTGDIAHRLLIEQCRSCLLVTND